MVSIHIFYYLNQKREAETLLWGKNSYIVAPPPRGKRLLYSQFPGENLLWGKSCYTKAVHFFINLREVRISAVVFEMVHNESLQLKKYLDLWYNMIRHSPWLFAKCLGNEDFSKLVTIFDNTVQVQMYILCEKKTHWMALFYSHFNWLELCNSDKINFWLNFV